MATIVCIVGRSGSGKTELAKALIDKEFPIISSNTTRPPRQGEIPNQAPYHQFKNFDDYFMDAPKTMEASVESNLDDFMVADTLINGNYYWAMFSTIKKAMKEGFCGYVIDPMGVVNLYRAIQKAKDMVINFKIDNSESEAYLSLFEFSQYNLKIVYMDASLEQRKRLAGEARTDRDMEQDILWDLCAVGADRKFYIPYFSDVRDMEMFYAARADMVISFCNLLWDGRK